MKELIKLVVGSFVLCFLVFVVMGGFGPTVTIVNTSETLLNKPIVFEQSMIYADIDNLPKPFKKYYPESRYFLIEDSESVKYMMRRFDPNLSVKTVSQGSEFYLITVLGIDTPWYHLDKTKYKVAVVKDRNGRVMEVLYDSIF